MSISSALNNLNNDIDLAKSAITAKGGTAPSGTADMAQAIAAIPSGGTPVINPLTVTENGTYTAPSGVDGYSPVMVNVSGTEVTMASTVSTMNKFAEAVFPLWPNGLEPNSFYVCFWNGLFDGSTPTADQVGYIATWTDAAGIARTSGAGCCRYRGGWATMNNISSNWACAVSIGDKYTWYKMT